MKQLQKQNEVKSKLIKYLLLQYGERFNDDLEVKKLKSEIDALESQMSGKEPMITDEEIDTEANKFQLAIYGGKFGFVSGAKWAIGLIHSRQEPTMRDGKKLVRELLELLEGILDSAYWGGNLDQDDIEIMENAKKYLNSKPGDK